MANPGWNLHASLETLPNASERHLESFLSSTICSVTRDTWFWYCFQYCRVLEAARLEHNYRSECRYFIAVLLAFEGISYAHIVYVYTCTYLFVVKRLIMQRVQRVNFTFVLASTCIALCVCTCLWICVYFYINFNTIENFEGCRFI